MRTILCLIAIATLILMVKKRSKGGLLEWIIVVIGFISAISLWIK